MKQMNFEKIHWKHRLCHGGELRKQRAGRGSRPLSSKDPLHVVLKAQRSCLGTGFRSYKRFFLIQTLTQRYAVKFHVKIEQISVQADHIHLLLRSSRRTQFQNFFRVLSGQIAQEMERRELLSRSKVTDTPAAGAGTFTEEADAPTAETGKPSCQAKTKKKPKLWKHRPFSRVIKGWRAYQTVRNYLQLNEKEALGAIVYNKRRLKGLSLKEWQALWV